MNPPLRVAIGQHSLAGCKPTNQDFHGAVVPLEPLLSTKGIAVALADGISSSDVSQLASAAAVCGFLDDYYLTSEAWTVRRAAQRVLAATHSWLHAQTRSSSRPFDDDRGYVCTFSALVVKGREAHILHIGDSRIYRLHRQALEQLTEDHRVRLSSVETYLGRALGAGTHADVDYRTEPIEVGDVYLLATDGAYEHLDAAAVHAALAAHPEDLDAAAAALAALALERGSRDNITVQLVRVDALPPADASMLQRQRAGLRLPPMLSPRMRFEGYTIVRELQASARSHVYLATDGAGRAAVLKTPAVDLHDDPAALDRFMLEEWVARRIDHPNVLRPCEDPGRTREHLYVAMEAIEGQTLAQWMIDHPKPPLDPVRAIVEQIGRGLQAFHRRSMLHQDLRPQNVMIDRSGHVRIIDFASAHVAGLAETEPAARGEAIVGTLQYTAPEYFVGEGGSEASELFALAVLTYQVLSGALPYGLEVTRLRRAADLRTLRYVPLRHHRPDLPAWLDAVLKKALQPEPARRQESLSEFTHALRTPGADYQRQGIVPLAERDPVRFWQGVAMALALVCGALAWVVVLR